MSASRIEYRHCTVITMRAVVAALGCTPSGPDTGGPVSAEASLDGFRLDPELRIEIFAAEPYVRDPVAVEFDEYGRAFVAEMLGYPFDPDPETPPRGRIRMLKDDDGDGRIDGAAVFADSIYQITGLQPWNGGFIVTAAPDILYLRDTDGDDRADDRRVLFTGFSLTNPQHRVSTPRFALDNGIYLANDGQPGTITPVAYFDESDPAEAISVLGADFRFRMDRASFEPASGPAQYGQTFDARGQRFIAHNTIHVRHVVLPRTYLARNPFLAARATAHDISDHGLEVFSTSPPEPWRLARTEMRSRRYEEESPGRTEPGEGYFTGVAGGAIYLADALPSQYVGNLFTGEVAANLVHRDLLEPVGPTFFARRAPDEQRSEFLTSTDTWFRPVTLTVGPDGALYLVDMYRQIIESPEYMPEPVRERLDFYRGTERGRIYRIVARGREMAPRALWPGHATTAELVPMLNDPNQWVRLTSHRLLIEHRDTTAIPLLRQAVREGPTAAGRLHQLYVLESLEALDERLLADALRDEDPGVREHALRLAERYPRLASEIERLASDPDPRVRFQAALSLGRFRSPQALAQAASRDTRDPWFTTAVLTAAPVLHLGILRALISHQRMFNTVDPGEARLLRGIASVIGARASSQEIAWLLARLDDDLSSPEWRDAVLSGLAAGLDLAGVTRLDLPQGTLDVGALGAGDPAAGGLLISDWSQVVARAADESLPVEQRRRAARRLASARFEDARAPLERMLGGDPDLERAALDALSRFARREVADVILANWSDLAVRDAAIRILASRQSWLSPLLDAVSDGRIAAEALDADVRLRLLENPNASIRARAAATIRAQDPRDVVAASRSVTQLDGDPRAGRSTFYARCAQCHLGGEALGPDLLGVSNKSEEQLLEAILAPGRGIPGTYTSYVAVLTDESILSGRIVAESRGTLTLRSLTGDRTILRSRIRDMRQSERSMMPNDAAQGLSTQELADLISYLRAESG